MNSIKIFLLAAIVGAGEAFVAPAKVVGSTASRPMDGSSLQMSAFDGIKEPVQSYVNIWYVEEFICCGYSSTVHRLQSFSKFIAKNRISSLTILPALP